MSEDREQDGGTALVRSARFSVALYALRAGGPVNWRLLSGNNRECGRGVGGFADADACRAFVAGLQGDLPLARRRCRSDGAGRWGWELTLDDEVVASSGHTFDRLVRCEQGARLFVAEFAAAAVRPTMVVSGSRRWGSVA